jgi:hypothetical protein
MLKFGDQDNQTTQRFIRDRCVNYKFIVDMNNSCLECRKEMTRPRQIKFQDELEQDVICISFSTEIAWSASLNA